MLLELLEVDGPVNEVLDLRISGDGSKILCFGSESIEFYDIQTGERVGEHSEEFELLAMDGSSIWLACPLGGYLGWDFRVPDSSPCRLTSRPPDRLHPNGTKLWDRSLSIVKDTVTGKVVFQLPIRFGTPIDVQWNGQYLVVCLKSRDILILEFHPTFLQ